jgi:hypothetical protein
VAPVSDSGAVAKFGRGHEGFGGAGGGFGGADDDRRLEADEAAAEARKVSWISWRRS